MISRFDDLLSGGLRELLGADGSVEIVAAGVERDRLSVVIAGHVPDVAIIDGDTPGMAAEIKTLSARHPRTSLVVLLHSPSDADCSELLGFGATACLGTGAQARDVLNAIHLASRGLRLAAGGGGVPGPEGLASLTRRETELLPLLREGHSNAEIALALAIGVETVRTHTRSIYRKLGISSRRELIAPPRPEPAKPPALQSHPRRSTPARSRSRHRGHDSRRH